MEIILNTVSPRFRLIAGYKITAVDNIGAQWRRRGSWSGHFGRICVAGARLQNRSAGINATETEFNYCVNV